MGKMHLLSMKTLRYLSLFVSAALLLAAAASCHKAEPEDDGENPYKALELTTKSAGFVQPGNVFAFHYLDRVNAATQKDYVISPLSLQFLLGMLLDGAQGSTADQICKVLGYGAGETAAVDEYCRSMMQQLPKLDKKTTLAIADAIFVDEGWPLKKSYKTQVANYYEAVVENLDFGNSAKALKVINGWCNEHTNGLIPKVLDDVSKDMLAYLMNAVYFKSEWTDKFPKGATASETFTDEAGKTTKVKMMKQEEQFLYRETEAFQAVRLPYGNGAFLMTVVLPKGKAKIADITKKLAGTAGDDALYGYSSCKVDLWLPRFSTDFRMKLNDLLIQMGMPDAFDGSKADFRAMSDYALCLSFVQQDAAIRVDEEGTEAAAISTAGMFKNTAVGPDKTAVFHADHPFLYLITESSTGAVLFAGRYAGK